MSGCELICNRRRVQCRGRGDAVFKFLLSTLQSMGVLYISLAVSDDCLRIGIGELIDGMPGDVNLEGLGKPGIVRREGRSGTIR